MLNYEDTDLKRKLLASKNILLCEDDSVTIVLIRLILENANINVTCAEDGKEGLEIFKASENGNFDAVLMDICMPNMNGIEATEAIRELDREDARNIPIIAMTANTYDEDREKSFKAGMTAYLCKPINVEKLFETLEEQCI